MYGIGKPSAGVDHAVDRSEQLHGTADAAIKRQSLRCLKSRRLRCLKSRRLRCLKSRRLRCLKSRRLRCLKRTAEQDFENLAKHKDFSKLF